MGCWANLEMKPRWTEQVPVPCTFAQDGIALRGQAGHGDGALDRRQRRCPRRTIILQPTIERIPHPPEAHMCQKPIKLLLSRGKIDVMTPTNPGWHGDARLMWIEFPGVNVKKKWLILQMIDLA